MAFSVECDRLTVHSRHAWALWGVYLLFLLGFPAAVLAMWRAGPEAAPRWFALVLTALFLVAVPFLLREIARARLVRARLDRASGAIHITKRGLFTHSRATRTFDDIERVEMRTSDNDGAFHTLHIVFRDGTDFAFSHGNAREGMEAERDRMLEFLRGRLPDATAVEVFEP